MTSSTSYRWMRRCLEMLYDDVSDDDARQMLTNPDVRDARYAQFAPALEEAGMPVGMLASSEGQSLGVAILALRLRFPRQDGLDRVDLNIAMREGRV
ncbi:MAG: hypothetical protein M9890_06370 [Thermomicrobiales bacterium]|nr:hypothetical protein [Thermomicrobiales bacterium]